MHDKYRMPNGKLVAVDFDVVDGKLSQVVVSGDFFLEPDKSLNDIVRALTDLLHISSVTNLAAAINSCLPKDAQLLGFSPEAVSIAVRHTLGHVTNWDGHTFGVVGPITLDPRLHVALDEILAARMARGEVGPSFRIWDWDQPLMVIGSFQSYRNEIDEEGREYHGINVVWRITSGGAMLMEPGNCVTYSLLVPGSLVEDLGFECSYGFLDRWVMEALAELEVMARYVPLNDIASDKGEIVGTVQRRLTNGAVLRHMTIAYGIGADKMLQVLRIGREKLSGRGMKSANRRVDPLRSQTQLPHDQIIDSFLKHFEPRYSTRHRNYTDDELTAAAELVEKKFTTPE